ncbi:hypothetical protein ACSBR2_029108 [Camellia fascicularis]
MDDNVVQWVFQEGGRDFYQQPSSSSSSSSIIQPLRLHVISIAFPDDGAWKQFHKQVQHFPMIVCTKVREGDQQIVCLKEGDPRGRHVVIINDLVQSSGTLTECQKVLAKHGAAKISAYVTHGIFPNRSWERFKHDNGGPNSIGNREFAPLVIENLQRNVDSMVWVLKSCASLDLRLIYVLQELYFFVGLLVVFVLIFSKAVIYFYGIRYNL